MWALEQPGHESNIMVRSKHIRAEGQHDWATATWGDSARRAASPKIADIEMLWKNCMATSID
jgi:hypothetical protein